MMLNCESNFCIENATHLVILRKGRRRKVLCEKCYQKNKKQILEAFKLINLKIKPIRSENKQWLTP